jgi:hypothetical protein
MIWAVIFGLFVGLAIGWVCGIAYGVHREQDRLIELGWRRLREEQRWHFHGEGRP